MTTKELLKEDNVIQQNEDSSSIFGLELLRTVLLPELLGKENNGISYWAGKSLARHYPLSSVEDIISFFKKASWGDLNLLSNSKMEMIFELSSSIITERYLNGHHDISYQLEAGFLAEQIQNISNHITETYTTEKKGKEYYITFKVRSDKNDLIDQK